MARPRPTRRAATLALALIGLRLMAPSASAQRPPSGRQVTLFGIHATPGGGEVDPKLKKIEPQLKKLFPGHGFRLMKSESKRLTVGQSVEAELDAGWLAKAELLDTLDREGNVQFRFGLELDGHPEFATVVRTPPNQLFFCDKLLPDGSRLLIGLGGR